MTLPLGKTSARPEAVKLKFSTIVTPSVLPVPPLTFGHYSSIGADWGELGNSDWGDCVWAGAAHEHMLWAKASGLPSVSFDDADVLSDYSIVTGFSFSADTDNGTDMELAAAYRRKTGVLDAGGARHQIAAYMALRVGDFDELISAAWLFGAVGIGINFPVSAEQQFKDGAPWSIVPDAAIVGGHYVPIVGRAPSGNLVAVTWGRTQEITREFYELYNDEGLAYYSPEYVDVSKLSPEGFDSNTLETFLNELVS